MEIKLVSGGRLMALVKSGDKNWVDITDKAHTELGNYVTLENVTVRDIFTLIKGSPILRAILAPDFIESYLAHMEKFPEPVVIPREKDTPQLEFLEIYHQIEYDKFRNAIYMCEVPHLHGLSEVVTAEMADDCYAEGSRVAYAIEFRNFEELLDLPVRFNGYTTLQSSFMYSAFNNEKDLVVDVPVIKLLDVMRALTWEISFFGSPDDVKESQDVLAVLKSQAQELIGASENGTLKNLIEKKNPDDLVEKDDGEDSFEFLISSEVIDGVIVCDEQIKKSVVAGILENLPDYVIVEKFLKKHFEDKVTIKPGFEGLCAYAYRYKIYNEGKKELEPINEKMLKKIKNGLGLAGHKWQDISQDNLDTLASFGVNVISVEYFENLT